MYHCVQISQLLVRYTKAKMVYMVAVLKRCQEIVFIRKIDAPAVGVIKQ